MREPKIILFDLETLPNLPEALKVWCQLSQYPGKTMKATITTIICAGWKQYGRSHKVECINAWDFPEWERDVNDDKQVCKALYEVLKDADAVITHNGVRFDWKFVQTRFLFHGLPILDKIPHIDTCLVARKNLLSFNNTLGYLGEWLVGDSKMTHGGWKMWVKVHAREKISMDKMEKYCKKDVTLLEKVYIKLLPFIKNLPNRNQFRSLSQVMKGKFVCPTCGSYDTRLNGYRRTKTMVYRRLVCRQCKSWSRCDYRDKNPRTYQ